ncbi:hydrolase [Spartinivicinus ruber]|uniref:hydrolase n=1 Tax=Spartinivicinus ruber TaxID=2683272 RepID=UPI0013D61103|nr:hydrolase [Spartinivicinus ruber]
MNNNTFAPYLDWLDSQHNEMVNQTIELANINSGSLNAAGVNQVRQKLSELTRPLNGEQTTIAMPDYEQINDQGDIIHSPLGDALSIIKRPNAPFRVFLCGHMDTVFGIDHHFQSIRWLDDNTLNGPGVTDLKGGIMVMLKALECFEQSPFAEKIGWEILFNPDEEIGSPSSKSLFAGCAERNHIGFIYEPCFPDGDLAGARKGSGNFTVVCRGKAAHAGREHHLGRNAIRALSDFISQLDDLNGQRDGVTINPGFIQGGGPVNIVPDLCISKFNIRLHNPADEIWCLEQLNQLVEQINQRDGISLTLHGEFGRKPKVLSTANTKLFELAQSCGQALGLNITWKPTGGCCDGNNLAAHGLPNIDTLGVQGGNIHSDQEYLKVDSLVARAKLSALLLFKLATGDQQIWLEH